MTDDLLHDAKEELKRADHSIYISLKYTRTVDIIKSVIIRLINAADLTLIVILNRLLDKKRIKEIPFGARPRADLVAQKFPQFKKFIQFYYLLRDINKAHYDKKEEYKKNVALIVMIRQHRIDIDIETLKNYYFAVNTFLNDVDELFTK